MSGRGKVVRGAVVSFNHDPRLEGEKGCISHYPRGAIAIGDNGRIAWVGEAGDLPAAYADWPVADYGDKLVLPGFIDPHIHFPQYRMLAAPGADLLDWLNRFTFPEEARYGEARHAQAAAEVFLDRLTSHGTTAACVFSSVHKVAAEALFAAAEKRGMALAAGKTMMDRNAPEELCDEAETSALESEELIERWHGRGRLAYAITPRFAITSSPAQLAAAGALVRAHPHLLVQTHLSEQAGEIEEVARLYPAARDYTDVYDHFGLVTARTLFGHGIHLSERELARLSEAGSRIVHCPTSNTFLGSGLFSFATTMAPQRPVMTAIASDIGGGTSYSLLANMAEATRIARATGSPLSVYDAFYTATLGNARAMHMDDQVGRLAAGLFADLVVLDTQATEVLKARHELSQTLAEQLFAVMMLGDDRAIAATWIAGRPVYERRQP